MVDRYPGRADPRNQLRTPFTHAETPHRLTPTALHPLMHPRSGQYGRGGGAATDRPYCRFCCACRPVGDAIDDNWPSFPNVERGLSTDRTPRCRYGRGRIGRLIDVGLSDSADPSRGPAESPTFVWVSCGAGLRGTECSRLQSRRTLRTTPYSVPLRYRTGPAPRDQ